VASIFEGEAELMDDVLGKAHIILYNGVFNGRVLKIDYRNKKTQIFQYGAIVLRHPLIFEDGGGYVLTHEVLSVAQQRRLCRAI
jgi:hypothetical protein